MKIKRSISLIITLAFVFNIVMPQGNLAWAVKTDAMPSPIGAEPPVGPGRSLLLSPADIEIPPVFGSVKESFQQDGEPKGLIVHIQDLHTHYEAHKNIQGIIEHLARNKNINVILCEAKETDRGFAYLRPWTYQKAREAVAEENLKEGILTGWEALDLTSDLDLVLQGIEDKALYMKDMEAFLKAEVFREDALKFTGLLKNTVDNLKLHMYSRGQRAFDEKMRSYRDEHIGIGEYTGYLTKLAKKHKIDYAKFINLGILIETLDLEERIDFKKAEGQRDTIIEALDKRLLDDEKKTLLDLSMKFKENKISQHEFYQYLVSLAERLDISMNRYPHFSLYTEYIATYHELDASKLFAEVNNLENLLAEVLFTKEDQKRLFQISKNLLILKALVEFKLTPDEFDYYKTTKAGFDIARWLEFLKLNSEYFKLSLHVPQDASIIIDNIPILEQFYNVAHERDDAFIKNIEKQFSERNMKNAILMTGGFHTPGVSRRLKEAGYSYVVISPRIETEMDYEKYHKVLKESYERMRGAEVIAAWSVCDIKEDDVLADLIERDAFRCAESEEERTMLDTRAAFVTLGVDQIGVVEEEVYKAYIAGDYDLIGVLRLIHKLRTNRATPEDMGKIIELARIGQEIAYGRGPAEARGRKSGGRDARAVAEDLRSGERELVKRAMRYLIDVDKKEGELVKAEMTKAETQLVEGALAVARQTTTWKRDDVLARLVLLVVATRAVMAELPAEFQAIGPVVKVEDGEHAFLSVDRPGTAKERRFVFIKLAIAMVGQPLLSVATPFISLTPWVKYDNKMGLMVKGDSATASPFEIAGFTKGLLQRKSDTDKVGVIIESVLADWARAALIERYPALAEAAELISDQLMSEVAVLVARCERVGGSLEAVVAAADGESMLIDARFGPYVLAFDIYTIHTILGEERIRVRSHLRDYENFPIITTDTIKEAMHYWGDESVVSVVTALRDDARTRAEAERGPVASQQTADQIADEIDRKGDVLAIVRRLEGEGRLLDLEFIESVEERISSSTLRETFARAVDNALVRRAEAEGGEENALQARVEAFDKVLKLQGETTVGMKDKVGLMIKEADTEAQKLSGADRAAKIAQKEALREVLALLEEGIQAGDVLDNVIVMRGRPFRELARARRAEAERGEEGVPPSTAGGGVQAEKLVELIRDSSPEELADAIKTVAMTLGAEAASARNAELPEPEAIIVKVRDLLEKGGLKKELEMLDERLGIYTIVIGRDGVIGVAPVIFDKEEKMQALYGMERVLSPDEALEVDTTGKLVFVATPPITDRALKIVGTPTGTKRVMDTIRGGNLDIKETDIGAVTATFEARVDYIISLNAAALAENVDAIKGREEEVRAYLSDLIAEQMYKWRRASDKAYIDIVGTDTELVKALSDIYRNVPVVVANPQVMRLYQDLKEEEKAAPENRRIITISHPTESIDENGLYVQDRAVGGEKDMNVFDWTHSIYAAFVMASGIRRPEEMTLDAVRTALKDPDSVYSKLQAEIARLASDEKHQIDQRMITAEVILHLYTSPAAEYTSEDGKVTLDLSIKPVQAIDFDEMRRIHEAIRYAEFSI